jgi:SNF2 family DNA or RNA helicase
MNEFKKWCPSFRVIRFHGDKEERATLVADVLQPNKPHEEQQWDVCVTTYEIIK